MTINNPQKFMAGIWDWEILSTCFGESGIAPTDIDGFVERRGRFLILETKSIGAQLPQGQHRTFDALRQTGLFTILIVWGTRNSPDRAQVYTQAGVSKPFPCDLPLLQRMVAAWFKQVEAGKRVVLAPTIDPQ